MYYPKTFPADAFYLDRNYNIKPIRIHARGEITTLKGKPLKYISASSMFVTRARAVTSAWNQLNRREKMAKATLAEIAKVRLRLRPPVDSAAQ